MRVNLFLSRVNSYIIQDDSDVVVQEEMYLVADRSKKIVFNRKDEDELSWRCF